MIQALGDHASWARFGAATALGKIGDKRAVKPLTQLLKSETNWEVKEATEKALEETKTKRFPLDSWTVLEERSGEETVAATEAGEVYRIPKRGRIVDTGQTYSSTFGFGHTNEDDRIRQLWPERAEAIIERGNHRFWRKVGWKYKEGMVGRILALFKHASSGRPIYIMEFSVGEDRVYYPIGTSGVELVEGAT